MYTKAQLGKHPIHPMLVAFPVAFAINDEPFWSHDTRPVDLHGWGLHVG